LDLDLSGYSNPLIGTWYVIVISGGTEASVGPTGPTGSGGSGSRRTTLDSHDLICWSLDESASPFANSGSGGSCDLTSTASVIPSIVSVFGNGVYTSVASGARLLSPNTTVGSAASVGTLHGWVRPIEWAPYSNGVIKLYDPNVWSSPYISIGFYLDASTNGGWYAWISVSGSPHFLHITASWQILRLFEWQHVAIVFDGASLKAYSNGTLLGSTSVSGSIDWGNGGPWNIGDIVTNSALAQGITYDDWRFRDEALSSTQIEEIYRRGIGWYP